MAHSGIEVGKKAPAFTLVDQDGQKVKLSDFKDRWVVLYFYPKDDTPGCTKEACEFSDGIRQFEKLDAVILGCSPDSPESHKKFIRKYGLRLILLSDPGRGAMEKYGAFGEKKMYGKTVRGVIRSTVIVDPSGKVAHHWTNVRAAGHAEKVRDKLRELLSS
ncbi:MAG: peroxiredoxin [Acidobacteriota bacterium]|nr:MAG: peroxiredoxin [Acidobacteriota bacterium]